MVFFRFNSGLVGREVRVQAVRQGVPVETEPETAHSRGPVRQGPAARLPALRHELQAHQPPEQARDTVPAHRVRRQPRGRGRGHVTVVARAVDGVHVVHVHRAAHPQAAAAVPGRAAHHRRVHLDHHHVVAVADHTRFAFEKPEFGSKLEFQNPKTRQLKQEKPHTRATDGYILYIIIINMMSPAFFLFFIFFFCKFMCVRVCVCVSL